jgi:DNA-binding MarR family transcriptional regulator
MSSRSEKISGQKGPRVGGMMRMAQRWTMDQLYAQIRASGYEDLGRFHVDMFRANIPDGLRPTEVAEQLGITKQSVNQAVRDLEARGYLTLEPDPTDGRARVIRLTAKGHRLHDLAYTFALSAEQAIARQLGPRRFSEFKKSLEEINDHIANGDLQIAPRSKANPASDKTRPKRAAAAVINASR